MTNEINLDEKILFETNYPVRKLPLFFQTLFSMYLIKITLTSILYEASYLIVIVSIALAIIFGYIMIYLPLKELLLLKKIVITNKNLTIYRRFTKNIIYPLNNIYIKITMGNLRAIFPSNVVYFYNKTIGYKHLIGLRFKDFNGKDEMKLKEVIFYLTNFKEEDLLNNDEYVLLKKKDKYEKYFYHNFYIN